MKAIPQKRARLGSQRDTVVSLSSREDGISSLARSLVRYPLLIPALLEI